MTFRVLLSQQTQFVEDLLLPPVDPPFAGYVFSVEDCIPRWRCGPFFPWQILGAAQDTCWQGCHDTVCDAVEEEEVRLRSETVSGPEVAVGVEEPDTAWEHLMGASDCQWSPWNPWDPYGWSWWWYHPPWEVSFWEGDVGYSEWAYESSTMAFWCSDHHPMLAWPVSWWWW